MDNKDLRERFLNQFEDSKRKNEILAFLEQEVSSAYQRGREEMKKECLECLPPANKTYFENEGVESGGYNGGIKDCRTAINSIK